VLVHCPAHCLTAGQFVTAFGMWTLTQLESRPEQIHVIY
jgi:hypothetical protein